MQTVCGRGGTGRRATLRSLWVNNPWKFESSRPHQFPEIEEMAQGFRERAVFGPALRIALDNVSERSRWRSLVARPTGPEGLGRLMSEPLAPSSGFLPQAFDHGVHMTERLCGIGLP